jgi:hypothetical protein
MARSTPGKEREREREREREKESERVCVCVCELRTWGGREFPAREV